MNETIENLYQKENWGLGLAAWIFAGYSPLEKEQTGQIVRLADKEKIPFGCIEFREVAKEQKRIKRQLISRVKSARGLKSVGVRDEFHFLWLIDIAKNYFSADENIDIWWVKRGVRSHRLPAYLDPDLLSEEEILVRGSLSWKKIPTDELCDSISSLADQDITPLFSPRAFTPTNEFDQFMFATIKREITLAADKQVEIGGCTVHGKPRPAAKMASELVIKVGSVEHPELQISSERGSGGVFFLKWVEDEVELKLTMDQLRNRINSWFIKTTEGLLYDRVMGITKKLYFKGSNQISAPSLPE